MLPWNKQSNSKLLIYFYKTYDKTARFWVLAEFYGDVIATSMSLNEAAKTWLSKLEDANKTFLIQDGQYLKIAIIRFRKQWYSNLLERYNVNIGRRKIHFLFSDGTELCEEYDVESGLLLGLYTLGVIVI